MRIVKIILSQTLFCFIIIGIVEAVRYLILGSFYTTISNMSNLIILLGVFTGLTVLNERIVIKTVEKNDEHMNKIIKTLKAYGAKSLEGNRYKFSKLFSWDGIVAVEVKEDYIILRGPSILIRKFK